MDLTPLEHVGIALACVGIGRAARNTWAGATAGIFLFIGREEAQNEQRAIQAFYGNLRSNAPEWVGFRLDAMNLSSWLDLLCPIAAAILAALLITWLWPEKKAS